jgi:hypothetical protein
MKILLFMAFFHCLLIFIITKSLFYNGFIDLLIIEWE